MGGCLRAPRVTNKVGCPKEGSAMQNELNNMEEILNNNISGFHQYILNDPSRLIFVSQNFCKMTGYAKDELLKEDKDIYASLLHPADRGIYAEFLRYLRTEERAATCEYRLIRKDGTIFHVKDTTTPRRLSDGRLAGDSVLMDITDIKNENYNLQFLNETIPCGFLRYTCERQPKITYMNKQMMKILRLPDVCDGEFDYVKLYKENAFLMVPMQEHHKFVRYLRHVYSAGIPLAGEVTLLRCDGTKAHVFGWVTKCVNQQGVEEFQSVCMDVTARHEEKKEKETQRYLKALTDVYDKIFAYDLDSNMVKCLYSGNSPLFQWLENVSMQMEDATEKWIAGTVTPEDRDRVLLFFQQFCQKKLYKSGEKPPQIIYHSLSSDGQVRLYSGIFLKISETVSFYCCRRMPEEQEADMLRSQNNLLKENIQELVMRFTDGIAAFEVADGCVTPLYASENVCEFFGFTKEEWLPLMKKPTPIKEFVARSNVAYENFDKILTEGEAEFTYIDLAMQRERHIKAICSHKSPDNSSPCYVMLYSAGDTGQETGMGLPEDPVVSIRTFGYFDVFVGEKPIAFRNKKAKELFALLVDRRGGYITSEEAISFLWEDDPVNPVTLSRYRKVALRLKNTLEEHGISHVMETVDGKRRIVTEKVQCDLYLYLSGEQEYAQLFKGSYLNNYSWGENTLAELTGDILY